MRKCDFCKNELTCSGVNRSECIVRDFYNFEAERTPTEYLVQNGVSTKS